MLMNPAGGFILTGIEQGEGIEKPQTSNDPSCYQKSQGKISEDTQGTKGEGDETNGKVDDALLHRQHSGPLVNAGNVYQPGG